MLDDSLAHLKRQIEPRKVQIALLELLDNMQRVQIVVEMVAMLAHSQVELPLACVSKWRMPNVVYQRQSLHQIAVQSQRARNRAANLRHFQCVREPVAKMIGKARGENLCLGFQPAKCPRMHHTVAVPRVIVAVGMRRLAITPASRLLHVHRIRRKLGHVIHCWHCNETEPCSASPPRRCAVCPPTSANLMLESAAPRCRGRDAWFSPP